MILNPFNQDFFKHRIHHGIIYFLMLVALAMLLIAPIVVFLPAVVIAGISLRLVSLTVKQATLQWPYQCVKTNNYPFITMS